MYLILILTLSLTFFFHRCAQKMPSLRPVMKCDADHAGAGATAHVASAAAAPAAPAAAAPAAAAPAAAAPAAAAAAAPAVPAAAAPAQPYVLPVHVHRMHGDASSNTNPSKMIFSLANEPCEIEIHLNGGADIVDVGIGK